MSSPGDTINQLSTSTPLAGGASWTSQSMVLGQYNSLNIMLKSDQAGTLAIQWSGDNGLNYDDADSYSILAGTPKRITVVTQQKNIRMVYTNGGIPQTYFRLATYGVVTNNNVFATITSIGSVGVTGQVGVSNLPFDASGSLATSELHPVLQYDFMNVLGSSPAMNTNPKVSLYNDLYVHSGTASATIGNGGGEGLLRIRSFDSATTSFVNGKMATLRAGAPFDIRFTGAWTDTTATNGTTRLQGAGLIRNTSPFSLLDYMGFGYNKTGTDNYDRFGIYIVNKSVPTFVPRTSWNVDKADGTATLPILTLSALNGFRITRTTEGTGFLNFYIVNPNTGLYSLVHTYSVPSQAPSGSSWSTGLGLIYYMDLTGTVSSDNPTMHAKTFAFYSQFKRNRPNLPIYNELYTGSLSTTSETPIVSYALYKSASSIPGNVSQIYRLSASNYNGLEPLLVRVYNRAAVAGGAFSDINANLVNVQKNTTMSSLLSGDLIASFAVPANNYTAIELPDNLAYIGNWYDLTVTIQSNSTTQYYLSIDLSIN